MTEKAVSHSSKKVSGYTNLTGKFDIMDINYLIPEHCATKKLEGTKTVIEYDEKGKPKENAIPQEVRIVTIGNVDAGKCLAPETKVMMADGSHLRADDLDVGDIIMGQDNQPSRVTYLESGIAQMFQVSQVNANYDSEYGIYQYVKPLFQVTANHQLTFRVKSNSKELSTGDVTSMSCDIVCYNPDRFEEINGYIYDTHDIRYPYFTVYNVRDTRLDRFCLRVNAIRNTVWYIQKGHLVDIPCVEYLNLTQDVRNCLMGVRQLENGKLEDFMPHVSSLLEMKEYVGMTIDHPTQRFLVEDRVLTHNSTTVGVIKTQQADNGRGLARLNIFRHQHEIETGRTSAVGNQYIQYNDRLYSFSDLAGHEKYLKTTIYGLVAVPNDWSMLVIAANQGMMRMTREHLGIVVQLKMNLFIVVTKTDMAQPNVLESNIQTIKMIMSRIKRKPIMIETKEDLEGYYNLVSKTVDNGHKVSGIMDFNSVRRFVPIFLVSNVTMKNMDLLQSFIFNLRSEYNWTKEIGKDPVFIIDKPYQVEGVGLVLSGTVKHGVFEKGKSYMVGPFSNNFYPITIRNIRDNSETDIPTVSAGFSACFNIRLKDNKDKDYVFKERVENGMVVTTRPSSTKGFWANIRILHHPTKISVGYEPHLHCGGVKKTMKIIWMEKEHIQAGQETKALLEFTGQNCYVEEGDAFVFREGNTRGSGKVLQLATDKELTETKMKVQKEREIELLAE